MFCGGLGCGMCFQYSGILLLLYGKALLYLQQFWDSGWHENQHDTLLYVRHLLNRLKGVNLICIDTMGELNSFEKDEV